MAELGIGPSLSHPSSGLELSRRIEQLWAAVALMEPLEAELGVTAQFSIGRQQGFPAAPSPPPMMDSKKVLLRRTLQAVPYSERSIVEDVEYHQLLVQAGLRVTWVDDTQVRGDMPSGDAAAQQRARWEGGRLRLI